MNLNTSWFFCEITFLNIVKDFIIIMNTNPNEIKAYYGKTATPLNNLFDKFLSSPH